jgi:Ca2+-transporting ATPase
MLIITEITFVIQILIIQFAGAFFGNIPLPLDLWLILFAVSSSVVVVSEPVKLALWLAEKNK